MVFGDGLLLEDTGSKRVAFVNDAFMRLFGGGRPAAALIGGASSDAFELVASAAVDTLELRQLMSSEVCGRQPTAHCEFELSNGTWLAVDCKDLGRRTRAWRFRGITPGPVVVTGGAVRRSDRLLLALANEMRNRLFGVSATIDVLSIGASETDDQQRYGGMLQEELQRLAALVREIEELGRPLRVFAEGVAVSALVTRVLRACEMECTRRGVSVDTRVDSALSRMQLSSSALRTIITRMLEYGIERSTSGTSVGLDLSVGRLNRAPALKIIVRIAEREAVAREACKSNRPPISSPNLALTIVERYARAHGGWVAVAPNPGRGTRLTTVLPELEHDAEQHNTGC